MIIELEAIGFVKSPEKEPRRGGFREITSEIIIKEEFADGLHGLDEYSHLEVIFFMHLPDERSKQGGLRLKVHPMGIESIPEVGLFATRSPYRPNRIGLTICEILSLKDNVIRVRGLDAIDGTPILDIKGPSRALLDIVPQMRMPDWIDDLPRR